MKCSVTSRAWTLVLCSLALASTPIANADVAELDDDSGLLTFSGFARIDTNGCRTQYSKPAGEYILNCGNLSIDRTTEPGLQIVGAAPGLNATVDKIKADNGVGSICAVVDCSNLRPTADYRAGSFGIEFQFDEATLMGNLVTNGSDTVANGASRDCVYSATPIDLNAAGNSISAINQRVAGMTVAIVQNQKKRNFRVDLFNADGTPVAEMPPELAVQWSCAVP